MLTTHLQACGALLLTLSLLHLAFPARFQWRSDLGQLTLLNRQIFYVHTFFLCVILVMMGLVSLLGASALVEPSALGRWVAAGLMIFWQLRWITQHFVYDSSLWRGKPFETAVHIVLSALWGYLSIVYGWLLWHQLRG